MIITRVTLEPFGAFPSSHLQLVPGLNVILGPNETGKSTFFSAIHRGLFVPSNLPKRQFEALIKKFIPVGGGDTISVAVEFEAGGEAHSLRRTWGGSREDSLTMPDGMVVRDSENIATYLSTVLPAKEGTFITVLMAHQLGLGGTLSTLKKDQSPLDDLGAILRRAVYETDEVSVDGFYQKVVAEYLDYFQRWDEERGRPVDETKRYQRNVGQILRSLYGREDAVAALEQALEYETRVDQINQRITELSSTLDEKRRFVSENRALVEGLQDRMVLTSRLEVLDGRLTECEKDNGDWPVFEADVKRYEELLPGLRKRTTLLRTEREVRKALDLQKERRQRFQKLSDLRQELEDKKSDLAQVQALEDYEIAELRDLIAESDRLQEGLIAGELRLGLKARKDLALSIQGGVGEVENLTIHAGQSFEFKAEGRLKLLHADWDLEVNSGDRDYEERVAQLEVIQIELAERLKAHRVASVEAASGIHEAYKARRRASDYAQERFKEELGDDSFDALRLESDLTAQSEDARPEVEIVEELLELETEIKNNGLRVAELKVELDRLVGRYESKQSLLLKVAEIAKEREELTGELADLPSVPIGTDEESFLEQFELTEDSLKRLEQGRFDLKLQRKDLEKEEPDTPIPDLEQQADSAKRAFQKALETGRAIARIKQVTRNLMEEMDTNTFEGLHEEVTGLVATMTCERYREVHMIDSMPEGVIRQDGTVLPFDLFSAGTKDVLALALRLAMASHFLGDAEGVLILDDPIVDLDPERQKAAAMAVGAFGKRRQVLFFTCHPSHAEMLGGNRIELEY